MDGQLADADGCLADSQTRHMCSQCEQSVFFTTWLASALDLAAVIGDNVCKTPGIAKMGLPMCFCAQKLTTDGQGQQA